MPSLSRTDDVFVLDLGDGENRFAPEWVGAVEDLLGEVLATDGPRALVTSATGKFWSNGLDLEWMGANQDGIPALVGRVHELFAKFLEAAVPTVAAIQGHCFAAGAMLASAHDRMIMREDRGYFCLPEADIRIPFTPGMNALLMARLSGRARHEAMTTGRRYGGADALAAGIIDEIAPEGEVLDRAVAWAAAHAGKHGETVGKIKQRMYEDVLATLRSDDQGFG